MPRTTITAVLAVASLAVALSVRPAEAEDVEREIHVPAGWEGAYEFGYAPVIRVGDMVIVSGIPASGDGSYEEKIRRMYERAVDLLEAAGATLEDVVELTTFHSEPEDSAAFQSEFDRYMPIHKEFFGDHRPAWTAVGTTTLLSSTAPVEMRVIAVIGSGKSSRVVFGNPPIPASGTDTAAVAQESEACPANLAEAQAIVAGLKVFPGDEPQKTASYERQAYRADGITRAGRAVEKVVVSRQGNATVGGLYGLSFFAPGPRGSLLHAMEKQFPGFGCDKWGCMGDTGKNMNGEIMTAQLGEVVVNPDKKTTRITCFYRDDDFVK